MQVSADALVTEIKTKEETTAYIRADAMTCRPNEGDFIAVHTKSKYQQMHWSPWARPTRQKRIRTSWSSDLGAVWEICQNASINQDTGRREQDQLGKNVYVRPDRLFRGSDLYDLGAVSKICNKSSINQDTGLWEQDKEKKKGICTAWSVDLWAR